MGFFSALVGLLARLAALFLSYCTGGIARHRFLAESTFPGDARGAWAWMGSHDTSKVLRVLLTDDKRLEVEKVHVLALLFLAGKSLAAIVAGDYTVERAVVRNGLFSGLLPSADANKRSIPTVRAKELIKTLIKVGNRYSAAAAAGKEWAEPVAFLAPVVAFAFVSLHKQYRSSDEFASEFPPGPLTEGLHLAFKRYADGTAPALDIDDGVLRSLLAHAVHGSTFSGNSTREISPPAVRALAVLLNEAADAAVHSHAFSTGRHLRALDVARVVCDASLADLVCPDDDINVQWSKDALSAAVTPSKGHAHHRVAHQLAESLSYYDRRHAARSEGTQDGSAAVTEPPRFNASSTSDCLTCALISIDHCGLLLSEAPLTGTHSESYTSKTFAGVFLDFVCKQEEFDFINTKCYSDASMLMLMALSHADATHLRAKGAAPLPLRFLSFEAGPSSVHLRSCPANDLVGSWAEGSPGPGRKKREFLPSSAVMLKALDLLTNKCSDGTFSSRVSAVLLNGSSAALSGLLGSASAVRSSAGQFHGSLTAELVGLLSGSFSKTSRSLAISRLTDTVVPYMGRLAQFEAWGVPTSGVSYLRVLLLVMKKADAVELPLAALLDAGHKRHDTSNLTTLLTVLCRGLSLVLASNPPPSAPVPWFAPLGKRAWSGGAQFAYDGTAAPAASGASSDNSDSTSVARGLSFSATSEFVTGAMRCIDRTFALLLCNGDPTCDTDPEQVDVSTLCRHELAAMRYLGIAASPALEYPLLLGSLACYFDAQLTERLQRLEECVAEGGGKRRYQLLERMTPLAKSAVTLLGCYRHLVILAADKSALVGAEEVAHLHSSLNAVASVILDLSLTITRVLHEEVIAGGEPHLLSSGSETLSILGCIPNIALTASRLQYSGIRSTSEGSTSSALPATTIRNDTIHSLVTALCQRQRGDPTVSAAAGTGLLGHYSSTTIASTDSGINPSSSLLHALLAVRRAHFASHSITDALTSRIWVRRFLKVHDGLTTSLEAALVLRRDLRQRRIALYLQLYAALQQAFRALLLVRGLSDPQQSNRGRRGSPLPLFSWFQQLEASDGEPTHDLLLGYGLRMQLGAPALQTIVQILPITVFTAGVDKARDAVRRQHAAVAVNALKLLAICVSNSAFLQAVLAGRYGSLPKALQVSIDLAVSTWMPRERRAEVHQEGMWERCAYWPFTRCLEALLVIVTTADAAAAVPLGSPTAFSGATAVGASRSEIVSRCQAVTSAAAAALKATRLMSSLTSLLMTEPPEEMWLLPAAVTAAAAAGAGGGWINPLRLPADQANHLILLPTVNMRRPICPECKQRLLDCCRAVGVRHPSVR